MQIADGECPASAEAVLALLHRCQGAGDDGAYEIGIAPDLEAAVSGLYAALLGNALVVAVDLALSRIDAASDGHVYWTKSEAAANRLTTAGEALLSCRRNDPLVANYCFFEYGFIAGLVNIKAS